MIIKFNLLPKEELVTVEVKERTPIFLKVYSSFLLFLVITLTILVYDTKSKIASLEADKKRKEETLRSYKNTAQKVKEMEKENEEIKRRIEVILALKGEQGRNLRNMAYIFQTVNATQLQFSAFRLDNTKAEIRGVSKNMDFLAIYLQGLEINKEIIKSVKLKTAQQKAFQDLKLVEFDLEVLF